MGEVPDRDAGGAGGLHLGSPDVGAIVGIEHEYVVSRDGHPLDFRQLIHGLDLGVGGLDPSDPNAYRCRWGGAITADGREAEVVSPPVTVAGGGNATVVGYATAGRHALEAALADLAELTGYSTHLNVEVRGGGELAVARRVAGHFAPALMLMMDRPSSPGLLVRPRPGRVEIGGEYVDGPQLRAALVFGAAAVRCCSGRGRLPPTARATVVPAVERYGWYIDRASFGTDLYADGRATALRVRERRLGRARSASAQTVLARAWELSRPCAERWTDAADLLLVDAIVEGRAPLPMEGDIPDVVVRPSTNPSAFGRSLEPRQRPSFGLRAVVATWQLVVFEVTRARRTAIVAVPRTHLDGFMAAVDGGTADAVIESFLSRPPGDRVLRSADQAAEPTLFDRIGDAQGLVPTEREPGTGRLMGPGGASPGDRPGKRRRPPERPAARRAAGKGAIAATIAAVVVVVAGVVALASPSKHARVAAPPTSLVGPAVALPHGRTLHLAPAAVAPGSTLSINGTWKGPGGVLQISGDPVHRGAVVSTNVRCEQRFLGQTAFRVTGAHGRYSGITRRFDRNTCALTGWGPIAIYLTTPTSFTLVNADGTQVWTR